MKKETLNEILTVMAIKARLANIYEEEGKYSNNKRQCPFYSELVGMEEVLKIMGIEFEYEFNKEVTEITAIKAKGVYVAV